MALLCHLWEELIGGRSPFLCIKSPSSPLSTSTTLPKWGRHRLDHEPSREASIKYDSFPGGGGRGGQSMAAHSISTGPGAFLWSSGWAESPHRRRGFTVLRSSSEKSFFPPGMYKKISSFLSVCCLGMSRGVLAAQQWPQDREALEESAKTHAAARLRLRRPSGGSLWPPLSLCKNQCSPMMCYVKFPEAWFKWLDILHASLVILQCIAPKSTWTLHEKQM